MNIDIVVETKSALRQRKMQKRYLEKKSSYKASSRENSKRYISRNREFVYQYLLKHPCVDCGEQNPILLDFDHLRDKRCNVSKLVYSSCSLDTIKREIIKCVVRCTNCHRLKLHKKIHGGFI